MQLQSTFVALVLGAAGVQAHTVAWVKGMYCLGGNNASVNDYNTNTAVNPLFNLTKENWWFQHDRGCDNVPPKAGDILSLPANGNFTVELGHNRAMTTLSREGKAPSDWPDGQNHPDDYTAAPGQECVSDGALHTVNQTLAWGSAWAISYQSDLSKVTMDNLVVFSTLAHTPWKRLATYQVPDLPACPAGGCTCAWLWVPRGCGEPNMYMAGYKCNVTNAKSTKKLGTALPPTYCKFDQSKCQKGPKQMIAWNQQTGVNVQVPGGYYPGYNSVNGFSDGAQTDIFV